MIGRPKLTHTKRQHIIKARLTDEELKTLLYMQKLSGLNRTELIRTKLFHPGKIYRFDPKEMLQILDKIGRELGYTGNNINQLTKLSHIQNKEGILDISMQSKFNRLLTDYLKVQQELEKNFRQLLREIKKK